MNRIIHEKQDMTHLSWSKIRNSSGTAGSFLKAYSMLGGRKTYYKLSNYDRVKGEVWLSVIKDRSLHFQRFLGNMCLSPRNNHRQNRNNSSDD